MTKHYPYQYFNKLSPDDLREIESTYKNIQYKRKENIIKEGEPVQFISFLAEGYCKKQILFRNNHYTIDVISPGSLIGFPYVLLEPTYSYSIVALSDCRLAMYDINVFRSILKKNNSLALHVIEEATKKCNNQRLHHIQTINNNILGRVAMLILYLFGDIFKSKQFNMLISRYDIAQLTGISRENVSKALNELHRKKYVELKNKQIHILQPEKLEALINPTGE